jgi:hypothetical protein
VARRQHDKLNPPAVEIGIAGDEEGVGPLTHKTCESHLDLRCWCWRWRP